MGDRVAGRTIPCDPATTSTASTHPSPDTHPPSPRLHLTTRDGGCLIGGPLADVRPKIRTTTSGEVDHFVHAVSSSSAKTEKEFAITRPGTREAERLMRDVAKQRVSRRGLMKGAAAVGLALPAAASLQLQGYGPVATAQEPLGSSLIGELEGP